MMSDNHAACLIGWPAAHSRSPLIHKYWLKSFDIEGDYRVEAVEPEEFADFIASLGKRGYRGANVTIPHKEAALALSTPDDRARAVGASNTLYFKDDKLLSTNTDVEGFLGNLITHSKITIAKGSRKMLELPVGISRTELHGPAMNFIIFERKKDLFPLKAKKRFIVEEDEAAKAIAFSGFKEKLVQQDVISNWIDQINRDLKENGSVRFSDYFFAIVQHGSEAELTLAVGLTYRVMRFFEQHILYQLTIQSHLATKPDNKISLWEMTIQKR